MLATLAKAVALRSSPLFARLDAEALLPIADLARPAAVAAGERLFGAGERGDAAFVVVRGRIRLERAGAGSEELGPGAVVGELAALDRGPRAGTVTAVEASELLRFERDHWLDILRDHPEVGRALAVLLAERLR